MAAVVEERLDTELVGLGLRDRIEREHDRRTDAQLDAISPELVLILPPELAELARALLPDPPAEHPRPTVTPALRVTPPEPTLSRERAVIESSVFGLFCVAATFGPLLLLILTRT